MDFIYTQRKALPHIGAITRTRDNNIGTGKYESLVEMYFYQHFHTRPKASYRPFGAMGRRKVS